MSKIAFNYGMSFDPNFDGMKAGDVVTGVTSGRSAKINDVSVLSGSWKDGDAAGFLSVESDDEIQ